MRKLLTGVAIGTALMIATADARGRCDGFHACRCGTTQARYFGLPLNYNGYNLKLASDWKRAFQHVAARVGAVVYQTRRGGSGHVSRIVALKDHCTATVADDAGTYERNICGRGAVYLDVTQLSARGKGIQYAKGSRKQTQARGGEEGSWQGAY